MNELKFRFELFYHHVGWFVNCVNKNIQSNMCVRIILKLSLLIYVTNKPLTFKLIVSTQFEFASLISLLKFIFSCWPSVIHVGE